MPKPTAHPYILLTAAALFWALSAIVARHIAGEVPPIRSPSRIQATTRMNIAISP